ncbi:hypothetical protein RCO27_16515 [Sphingosinicella sp. LHD-64]|uniref:hypothetical protein n=1 Tax=Sphingosinicella sp. LHD-64 TaxID=3072139 RepID=UPI00280C9FA7|nr:hypothetical protein [Sphingosinicella sp. LHD-64]MDQ8757831.1 hypothetical protein [Sphingosinicella sp. LHD-64]
MFHSLVAIALAAAGPAGGQAPDRIAYSGFGNGWTGGRTTWSIDRTGRGHYESTESGRQESGRFDAGAEGFARVRSLLAPLEGLEEMPCDAGGITDQAMGGLSWERGREARSLRLDFGCAHDNDADAWTRYGEASALIVEWATQAR